MLIEQRCLQIKVFQTQTLQGNIAILGFLAVVLILIINWFFVEDNLLMVDITQQQQELATATL